MPVARADPSVLRLAARVRELRQSLGWSQERLAAEADLHRNYVGAVERAELNPTFRSVVRIATALRTTVCGLYPDETAPPNRAPKQPPAPIRERGARGVGDGGDQRTSRRSPPGKRA